MIDISLRESCVAQHRAWIWAGLGVQNSDIMAVWSIGWQSTIHDTSLQRQQYVYIYIYNGKQICQIASNHVWVNSGHSKPTEFLTSRSLG